MLSTKLGEVQDFTSNFAASISQEIANIANRLISDTSYGTKYRARNTLFVSEFNKPSVSETNRCWHKCVIEHLSLFNRDTLGEVTWLVYIRPPRQSRVIREQLQRHRMQNR